MSKLDKNSKYTKEFKVETIKLAQKSGAIPKTAKELGVSYKTLYGWIAQYEQDEITAFPGKGKLKPDDEELRKLRLENQRLKETNEILKKAAGYFATLMK